MKLLTDVGVSAIHVGVQTLFDNVAGGHFQFGMKVVYLNLGTKSKNQNFTVFMSPETAVNPPWRDVFQSAEFRKRLSLIAVDEAHCIAEWLDCTKYGLCNADLYVRTCDLQCIQGKRL